MAKPTAKILKRAHGRSLADFGVLSAAEADFIEMTRLGEWCGLGIKVPEAATPKNTIRAELIRFLALGGDEDAPVHERGVQLGGAWIEEVLDLAGGNMPFDLKLVFCRFRQKLVLRGAEGKTLSVSRSNFPGIDLEGILLAGNFVLAGAIAIGEVRLFGAKIGGSIECSGATIENAGGNSLLCDGAEVANGVFLQNNFQAKGEVRMICATIGGNIQFNGATIENFGGYALTVDGIKVAGTVFLNDKFHAKGVVQLTDATIGGNLECRGGTFENFGGNALVCDRAKVNGNVILNNKFHAKGAVSLAGATIGGTLECDNGTFENPGGYALHCQGLSIRSALLLRSVILYGSFNLNNAEVSMLVDDVESWQAGTLELNGFRYARLLVFSDASTRIAWLKKQHPLFVDSPDFAVQPWTHLAKVLREAGHERDAVKVEIERERLLAASGRMGKGMALRLHQIYGVLADYGYRPLKPLRFALGTWLWFALLYAVAGQNGWFGPSNPLVFQNPAYAHCRPDFIEDATTRPKHGNWVTCPELPGEYTSFSPLVYSLDMILPVIELGQARDWGPITPSPPVLQKFGLWQDALIPMVNEPVSAFDQRIWTPGLVLRFLTWTEQLLGWIFGIVLAGALTGLFQRKGE